MRNNPVTLFFLKVLMWLPVTFGVWYFMSIVTARLISIQVNAGLIYIFPEVFSAVRPSGYHLEVWARTLGGNGLVMFKINSLIYSNGLALYTALVIATIDRELSKWVHWLVGSTILLFATSWSICLEAVRHVMVDIPELQGQLPFSIWVGRLVYISERYNLLVLPNILPVIIWVGFHAGFLKSIYNAPRLVQSE